MFSCNLPPALSAERPGPFTCYCSNTGGGTDTEIRVGTESQPWRRKVSHCSCRDSNPCPFNHESGALTTELSPPPKQNTLFYRLGITVAIKAEQLVPLKRCIFFFVLLGRTTTAMRAAPPIPTSACCISRCPNNGTAASVWLVS